MKTDIVKETAHALGATPYDVIHQSVTIRGEDSPLSIYDEWCNTGFVPPYIIEYCKQILGSEGLCVVLTNRTT